MKRALLSLAVLGVAVVLGGCPIYPSSQSDYRVCDSTGCFDCPDPVHTNLCLPWSCVTDSDCGPGYACNGGQCLTPAPGPDCSLDGCPTGQICRLAGGVAACVSLADDAGAPAINPTGADDASLDGQFAFDAPFVAIDAPDAAVQDAAISDATGARDAVGDGGLYDAAPPDAAEGGALPDAASLSCNAGADCGAAARCIDGQCTPVGQLCSDGTQCVASGAACVDGVCTPRCSASAPCPAGYACDFQAGVCSLNPGSCTAYCPGGAVCVESRCVSPCGTGEAGACPGGQVCVNGGCIPDERAQLSCRNDGASGQLANACGAASVCLHHSCYVACDGDGGGCPASACKQVSVTAGTYAVCAAPGTLGSQCDVAAGNPCTGAHQCVDGYCK
jgi:hypothetical protein